jgi:hypothetical protein
MERLDARVRTAWAIGALITGILLGGVAFGLSLAYAPGVVWVGGVLTGGVALLGLVFSVLRYRRWGYEVQDDAVFIQRGVITHVRTVVPFVRVQHVDTQRGPVERALGLASVVVYTAGSRQADVTIPGLTPERADALQERLREMAIESEPEDAV